MGIRLFGAPRTRTYRCLWLAEEIGLDYEAVSIAAEEAAQHPNLLAVNPFGKVPSLDDDGLHLWESYAINHYLARKYGGDLGPQDLAEEGKLSSWAFWTATAIEPAALIVLTNGFLAEEEERDPERIALAMAELYRPLEGLETHIDHYGYLVGGRFTVADVNLVSVLSWVMIGGGDLAPYRSTAAWIARCGSRPAALKVLQSMGF
ncbi:MAG: glutathione S-transferase family protein [Rhodospirillales bacterium]|nr:glutathione S-transferase family protein [Rhodospirillales bacterium]